MRKVIIVLTVIMLLGGGTAFAEGFKIQNFNLGGDIHYVFNSGLNYGAGYHIGNFNEMLGLRASLIGKEVDIINKAGINLDISVSKVLEKAFGFDWQLGSFNPTFGAGTGVDFIKLVDGENLWDSLYVSLYVNIFRLEF